MRRTVVRRGVPACGTGFSATAHALTAVEPPFGSAVLRDVRMMKRYVLFDRRMRFVWKRQARHAVGC